MSRYPKVGNASSSIRRHSPYFTSTTSTTSTTSSISQLPSRSRHEQQQHQLITSYKEPRSTMTTLPTLPPISTLSPPYDTYGFMYPKSSQNDQYSRYSPSITTPQSTPTTPSYSTTPSSTTSSFSSSYLPSPLPQPSTPTQLSSSQPSYYQQRSPQTTSYYSQQQPYSSYTQYSQPNSPGNQPSRRNNNYPSQQQQSSSPIYNLQTPPPHPHHHHHHHQQSSSQQTHTPIRPYQRSHTSQNVISEPFVTVTPELNNRPPRRRRRPPFSYSSLIAQAILDSPDRRLTLREVYQWIMERYPQLYKADDTGWQNTIRHNLSLNKCFKKVPRSDTELGHSTSSSASKGKGGYWTIDPEYMSAYHDGVFARGGVQKRRPGEVGLHPGMGGQGIGDDDSGSSDTSPSDNMAGRLVEVDDDSESAYHHHHSHHHLQQHHHYHVNHNNTGDRMSLTLTVPQGNVSSSNSLMTPPLSSTGLLHNKPKKFYATTKGHSSEPNFSNLTSPSHYTNNNSSGSNSGNYGVFHVAELTDPSSDHSSSNRDISPYSVGSRSSGPSSEWNLNNDSPIRRDVKMEIDQGDNQRNYYYDRNAPRNLEIDPSHSSMAGSSSMKIKHLLN